MDEFSNWIALQEKYPKGSRVRGYVTQHWTFGIELRITGFECQCLIEMPEFKASGQMTPEEFPSIGTQVEADVLGYNESQDGKRRCKLSMKQTFGVNLEVN